MEKGKPSRFERKRAQILEAATAILNERGVSGMTMRDVAQTVKLTPATLAYYFKGKEDLATAAFQQRLDCLEGFLDQAAKGAAPRERIEILLSLELDRLADVFRGKTPPLASLPSGNENMEFLQVRGRIASLFARIDRLFGEPASDGERELVSARWYMFIGVLFYLPTWVGQYSAKDYPRVLARIMDVLEHGIAYSDAGWTPQTFSIDEDGVGDESAKQEFLRAATRLLNVSGYLGTSVDSIAEELNVTKGSFYHHLASKDELILECIRSNYWRVARAIAEGRAAGGSHLQQISSTIATLLDLQFEREWPLLRSTAFASLPPDLRAEVNVRYGRTALSFAGSISDGIAEGSVRAVDPTIASHIVNSALYSAVGLHDWSSRLPKDRAVALYASTLMHGIFDEGVLEDLTRPADATMNSDWKRLAP
jgi:AcrR family transcriptional regulator